MEMVERILNLSSMDELWLIYHFGLHLVRG